MADDTYDPYATGKAKRGKSAAAGDDVAITIEGGGARIETSLSQIEAAAARMDRESGAARRRAGDDVQGIAAAQLRSIVERIERLNEEKAAIADDIKAVFAEAKANGFDTKVLRQVIRLRKQDSAEREEFESILDLYKAALGMV